jgi:hypothetical protein
MACAVLIGILIDKTISATGSDGSGQDLLSLCTSPIARFFALLEGFDGTSSQSGTGSLSNSLLAALTATATTTTVATATA